MAANRTTVQQTKSGQFTITLPRALVGVKGWAKGTVLELIDDRYGSTVLKEVGK